jgi:hypothetical protein
MSEKPESAKNLRTALLQFVPFREKLVILETPQPDGSFTETKVLLRQPSVAQRDRIIAAAQGANGKMDGDRIAKGQALATIYCALDPETKQPIFTEADVEALVDSPAGGGLDQLALQAMKLMEVASQNVTKSAPGQE